jgi:hypothetical protein
MKVDLATGQGRSVNVLANLLDSIPKDIIHVDVAMSTASCMSFEKIFGAKCGGFSGRSRAESKSVCKIMC